MSNSQKPQFANSRQIAARVLVEGMLELVTPARFGGGEADDLLDMPLLLDAVEQRPLLTGASIAGALRNYLRLREAGYGQVEKDDSLCVALFGRAQRKEEDRAVRPSEIHDRVALFGRAQEEEEGTHSVLMTHDALGETPSRPETELRDGVAIDPATRTAEEKKKFDVELLAAGTRFKLRFELLLPESEDESSRRLKALAIALQGLERGEIGLGARKRRGFGQCRIVDGWTVIRYDVRGRRSDLVAWLKGERPHPKQDTQIAPLFGLTEQDVELDKRNRLTMRATFALDGSLLIRSGSGDLNAPDAVHLHSRRNGKHVPILSGTSLAGALRARALRIANTFAPEKGWSYVEKLFGMRLKPGEKKRNLTASRLIVHEAEIRRPVEPALVQSRVKIDRFTGGAYPTALFSEQPIFAKDDTEITIKLELLSPEDHQVGLVLLLLKDLWTGDLPLGGESSVGRGRLRGKDAQIGLGADEWKIQADGDVLKIVGDRERLEGFVKAFTQEVVK